jgi:ubiquinone/menaquinone biosynthesis C-methylase UbiE
VAPYYDELMKSVPYRMWVGYYFLLLARQGVHPKTVLDVCCGTGSMTEMLAREGFKMSGLDLSPEMIDVAKAKAAKKKLPIDYYVADATTFKLRRRYDAALSFFDSLNNITDPSALQDAFHRVAAHLKPGGSFIFDLNTEYAFVEQMFDQQNMRTKLRYRWEGHYDPSSKLIEVDMRFWRDETEFREVHVQRAYGDEEIREMLAVAGFEEICGFSSYTLDPIRPRADRVHYTCLKAR